MPIKSARAKIRAEVSAQFDLRNRADILNWLQAEDLAQQQECILRRSLSKRAARAPLSTTAL